MATQTAVPKSAAASAQPLTFRCAAICCRSWAPTLEKTSRCLPWPWRSRRKRNIQLWWEQQVKCSVLED